MDTATIVALIALAGTAFNGFLSFVSAKNKAKDDYVKTRMSDMEKQIEELKKRISALSAEKQEWQEKELMYLKQITGKE